MRAPVQVIRGKLDHAWFMVSGEWPFVVALAGVAMGVATLVPTPAGLVLSVLGLVLGLIPVVGDLRRLRRMRNAYDIRAKNLAAAALFPVADFPPPPSYPDAEYLFLPGLGTALVCPAIDRYLTEHDPRAELQQDRYRLPTELRALAPNVLRELNRGRLAFNGAVVGLHGDPVPPVTAQVLPLRLQRARYFDGQSSNEMFQLRIDPRDTGPALDLFHTELAGASGHLATLAESRLANAIGVSTIAVTNDGYCVVIHQARHSATSAGQLAPSGSGGLEPKDVAAGGDSVEKDLKRILVAGMERELAEESRVRPREIVRTDVVGFARVMERGGKPEFFGVTRLNVGSQELSDRPPSSQERYFVGRDKRIVRIDLAALRAELVAGVDLLAAKALPPDFRESGSLILLLNLRALALSGV